MTEKLLIATFFGALFLATVDNQLLVPLLPTIGNDLGASMAGLSRLFSGYALAAALANVTVGPLTDRWGRIGFLRLGLVLMAVLPGLAYLSRTYAELLLLRCLTGLAAGLLSICIFSLVGDLFPYHRRGKVMGIILGAYFLALVLGIPAGVQLAERWGWRVVFLCSLGLAAMLFGLSFISLRGQAPLPNPVRPPPAGVWSAYAGFFKERRQAGALAASFLISGATLAVLTFISGVGLTPVEISWLFAVAGAAALAGSPLAGWLSDRWGKRQVFLLCNTLLVLPLAALPLVRGLFPLAAIFFGVSLLVAARQAALQTLQTELIGRSRRGAFLGLRNGCSQLGISVAVFISGQIFIAFQFQGVAWFAALLTLLGSLVLYGTVPEPEKKIRNYSSID